MMSRGKYAQNNRPVKGPVMLLLILIAAAAVIFAVIALVRSLNGEAALPNPPEQSDQQPGTNPTVPGQPEPSADETLLAQRRTVLLEQARELFRGYFYDEATELLQGNPDLQNDETGALLEEIRQAKEGLVKYTGDQYYHIFFHSLIVDTAKAFDGDFDSAGYDLYMTTVSEFQAMLPLLQEEGYILYDITQMVEQVDGKAVMKDIYLPAGKKPLILSVDDVNYYDYMKEDGFATRLDVDEEGNVVTIVDDQATYDGDVMPILDAYVKEHPEFSWRGAKGIVALTGYAGAFGYRITDLPDYDEATQKWMLDKTKAVAQALRASGWQIASHSYTHNQYWNNKTMTMEQEEYDTGRWLNEIAPYVGDTNIFISPFGVSFDRDDQRFRYLVDHGFWIYCPVDSKMPAYVRDDFFISGRLNLDGITMKTAPQRVNKFFFDPAPILDPARPK